MEYSLLKQVEPNIGFFFPSDTHPILSPYPALDYVNPGLAQVVRIHNFMVPLHTQDTLHMIQKEIELQNSIKMNEEIDQLNTQVGSGDTEDEKTLIASQIAQDPVTLNEKKRKIMGEPIFESFVHPKKLKIGELVLSTKKTINTPKNIETKDSDKSGGSNSKMKIKHNFSFM